MRTSPWSFSSTKMAERSGMSRKPGSKACFEGVERAEDMSTEWIRRRLELRLVLFRERFQVGRSPWES